MFDEYFADYKGAIDTAETRLVSILRFLAGPAFQMASQAVGALDYHCP
jgi:hypothetical protein